ncbi:MAG: DNA double-strand break repair nuclease NurA, partial [Anaerolineales bacterium]|nr:DNA double-strand break repair nuclease NurA [Anaerolineales bacterium]
EIRSSKPQLSKHMFWYNNGSHLNASTGNKKGFSMPLDYLEIRQEIETLASLAPERAKQLKSKQEQAIEWLREYANELDYLRDKAERANQLLPHFHVALPTGEPLNSSILLPTQPADLTLLAADGSQINPDRHMGTDYCLVNIGAIRMLPGSGLAPETTIKSNLYYGDEVLSLPEEIVAMMRDVRERQILAELAANLPGPVITLTDGPLELWNQGGTSPQKDELKQRYFDALKQLHLMKAVTAGYVDRPRNALLMRLLEIAPASVQPKDAGEAHPLLGLLDTDVLARVIKPGERSAIFGLLTRASREYRDQFALHFFYLNVSMRAEKPVIAKVDIPAWVAADDAMVNSLHAALVAQCQVMSAVCYPYVLTRADEIAVVTRKDKQKVADMIASALRSSGQDVIGHSSKQQGKEAAR